MKRDSTINGFVSGRASVYELFWEERSKDLKAHSPKEGKEINDYLTQQVFGRSSPGDDDFEDQEMQVAFTQEIRQEIAARATKKEEGRKGQGVSGRESENDVDEGDEKDGSEGE